MLVNMNEFLEKNSSCYRNLLNKCYESKHSDEVTRHRKENRRRFAEEHGAKACSVADENQYFKFYADNLEKRFKRLYEGDTRRRFTFVDVGSAPGGMSKFLMRGDFFQSMFIEREGYAFSLDLGYEMKFKHQKLIFEQADLSACSGFNIVKNRVLHKVDFLNLGVVICSQANNNVFSDKFLQLRIDFNSFKIMSEVLAEGGSMMWVHSTTPDIDLWFFILSQLNKVFRNLTVFKTLFPHKSPVYVLCEHYMPTETNSWLQQLRSYDCESVDKNTWVLDTSAESQDSINEFWNKHREQIENCWNCRANAIHDLTRKREAKATLTISNEPPLPHLLGCTSDNEHSVDTDMYDDYDMYDDVDTYDDLNDIFDKSSHAKSRQLETKRDKQTHRDRLYEKSKKKRRDSF